MSVSTLEAGDRAQWEELFRQYIIFYKTSLPDEQYDNTWSRLLDPEGDLHAFVIREPDGKLSGIAHYFFHRDTWSWKPSCYLNGGRIVYELGESELTHIVDLFVREGTRKKGYGRELIVATEKAAEERGCYLFYWITQNENKTAQRVYDKFGESGFKNYRFTLPDENFR